MFQQLLTLSELVTEVNHGNKRNFLNGFIQGKSNRLFQKPNPKNKHTITTQEKHAPHASPKLSIRNLSYYWFFKIETITSCN